MWLVPLSALRDHRVVETRTSTVEYGLRRWLIVLGVVIAPLLETVDSSIVNVALPTIEGNLGATLDQATWIITGYLISNVVVIPLTPWLQKRFGRRQYFAVTVIGFTIASILCGMSTSIGQLIFFRVIQGTFGGGLLSTAQATLRDLFPPEGLGVSQAIFTVVVLVGPILAPMLGGYLIDNASWQWLFFINVVPGILSAAIIGAMLKNPEEPKRLPVDALGVLFLALALGGMQFMLDEGERKDWFADERIVNATLISIFGFIAFTFWELWGTRSPIVDVRLLATRVVGVGVLLSGGIAASFFGTLLMLPQYSQNILGFTAFDSGELLFFRAVTVMLFTPIVAGLVGSNKIDGRLAMAAGFVLTAWGSIQLAQATTSDTSFQHMISGLMIGGCGTAMLFIPLQITVQSTSSPDNAPKAGAFITLAFQLGESIASALMVVILDRRADFHADVIAGGMTLAHPGVRDALAAGSTPSQLFALVQVQAQSFGYVDVAYVVAGVAAVMIPFLFFMKRQRLLEGGVSFE